jgi:hypothetical protein
MNKGLIIIMMFLLFVSRGDAQIKKVHNGLEEIQKLEGKLQLELIQKWSYEDEMDENKIFYEPKDIAVNNEGEILVLEANRIKVFTESGKHLRTIGRAGQGPGEFLDPDYLEIDRKGNIVVMDSTNQRIQIISQEGDYQGGFPARGYQAGSPIAITQNNELLMLNRTQTTESSSLWLLYDFEGQLLDERGERKSSTSIHVTSWRYSYSFDLDEEDSLHVAAHYRPLLQIYSSTRELSLESTYEVPFEVPEIEMVGSVGRQYVGAERVSHGMDTDGLGRIFILALTRLQNLEEKKVGIEFMMMSRTGKTTQGKVEFDVDPTSTDLYQILVFDNSGKIIASKKLNIHANTIRIYKDRLFLIDTHINMKIYEYKISIL